MTQIMDFVFLFPALVAGLIVLLTHLPLGREVVRRGVIFMDLAIAQFAGVGLIVAGVLGVESHGWQLQAIAFTSALLGALFLAFMEKFVKQYLEAFIGICFVLAATLTVLLLANNPHAGEQLQYLLVGQILWVEWSMLIFPAAVSVVLVLVWCFARDFFSGKLFYLLFAVAITLSVQLVGVYLVFASLIIPALVTIKLTEKKAMLIAFMIGSSAYVIGLYLSSIFDLPSAALIVWSMAGTAMTYLILTYFTEKSEGLV